MNLSIIIGNCTNKPVIKKSKNGNIYTEIIVVYITQHEKGAKKNYLRVFAYGDECNYIYRYCSRGTLLLIQGQLVSQNKVNDIGDIIKFDNYVIASRVECLNKRQIEIDNFQDFIQPYSQAIIKQKLKSAKQVFKVKEEEQGEKEKIENGHSSTNNNNNTNN